MPLTCGIHILIMQVMTLTSRNLILISFLLIVTLFFLFFIIFLFYLAFGFPLSIFTDDLYSITETTKTIGEILITDGIYFVFSLVAGYFMKTYFRKTTSAEIFFFILYILSLSFRGLISFQIYVIFGSIPSLYGVLLTRFFIFGEIFGAGCLLCAGIFPTGIKSTRYGLFLGLVFLIAVIIATSIPIDSSALKPNLLYAIGNQKELTTVLYVLKFLAVVNFFIAGFFKNNREYFFLGLAILMTAIGVEVMVVFESRILEAAGLLSLCSGTVLFANRIHSVYMWR